MFIQCMEQKKKIGGELRETGDTGEAMLPKQKRPPRCTGILFFFAKMKLKEKHILVKHTHI